MSQSNGAIIRAASELFTKSLRSKSGEGSSPELLSNKMKHSIVPDSSPQWSVSQLIQSPSVKNPTDESAATTGGAGSGLGFNVPDEDNLFCLSNCLHNRKDVGKMLRCGICMEWFHFDCVGENTKYKAMWCCPSCRCMPKLLQKLLNEFELFKSVRTDTSSDGLVTQRDNLTVENNKLSASICDLREKVDKLTAVKLSLEQENGSLIQRLSTLEKKLISTDNQKSQPNKPNDKILLIGSSILRNVESQDTKKLIVSCHHGAKQADILETLQKETDHYKNCVGCWH